MSLGIELLPHSSFETPSFGKLRTAPQDEVFFCPHAEERPSGRFSKHELGARCDLAGMERRCTS
jgi:hypothetical protein